MKTKTSTLHCKVVEWENVNLFDKTKTVGYHVVFDDGRKVLVNDKELSAFIVLAVNSNELLREVILKFRHAIAVDGTAKAAREALAFSNSVMEKGAWKV